MAQNNIDRIARELAARPGRRRLGALVLGGITLVAAGPAPVAAKCVAIGKSCRRQDGSERQCCGGATCHGQRCRCPGGKKNSGGICAKRPHCMGAYSPELCTSNDQCCSKFCGVGHDCLLADPGQRCHRDTDCISDGPCVGFRCQG